MDVISEKYGIRPSTLLDPHRKHWKTDISRLWLDSMFILTQDLGKKPIDAAFGSVKAEILQKRKSLGIYT